MENKKQRKKEIVTIGQALSLIVQIGLTIVITILLSLYIGKYLDSKFSTGNIFSLVFLFLGVCAGIRNMYLMVRELFK